MLADAVRQGGRAHVCNERLAGFLLALAFVANDSPAAPAPCAEADVRKPEVILETDFTLDVDDVGALAVLHALADRGEANILAVSYNEAQRNAAAAIRSVNAWYGRANLPVGVFRGPLADPDDEHSRYIDRLAQMVPPDGDALAESSHAMYRRVLRAQPDGSVTIVSVGFLNNLHDLLRGDGELVRAKVRKLVLMGGVRNDGFNFVRHNLAGQTQHVLTHWPTPIVVSEEGGDIRTGTGAARRAGGESGARSLPPLVARRSEKPLQLGSASGAVRRARGHLLRRSGHRRGPAAQRLHMANATRLAHLPAPARRQARTGSHDRSTHGS